MYGIQARTQMQFVRLRFENDVKLYGIQAVMRRAHTFIRFENDVKLYGIQAIKLLSVSSIGLRMM